MTLTANRKQKIERNGITFLIPASFSGLEEYANYIKEQYNKAVAKGLKTMVSQYEIIVKRLKSAGL